MLHTNHEIFNCNRYRNQAAVDAVTGEAITQARYWLRSTLNLVVSVSASITGVPSQSDVADHTKLITEQTNKKHFDFTFY